MQTYQSTPDYYRDYIEHGWLKDQAAKAHKYIERWRGKNGKWYYRYKSKGQELGAKVRRYFNNYDDETTSVDIRKEPNLIARGSLSYYNGQSRKAYVSNLSGKASSYSGQHGSKINAGTSAGRKRVKKLGVKGQHQKGDDLRSRGYSSSFGSATSFGNHVTNRNWRQDRDAQNWADVYSGRKTFDQYKKTSRWDDSQSSGSMRDVRAGIYAGRKRRRKKK